MSKADLVRASPQDLRRELAARVKKRLEDVIMAGSDADPVRFNTAGYRSRYYETRFGASPGGSKLCNVC